MLAAAETHWAQARLAKKLHLERFSAVLGTSAEGGHVTFAISGKEADVDGATTLLEAGEAAGIQMPFGCRMGICHTCIVPLQEGRGERPAQRCGISGERQRPDLHHGRGR